jgi:hypothetical protein
VVVFCLRWSCCFACIVSDWIMRISKPLVVFFGRAKVGTHVLSFFLFTPSPLSQRMIHLLSFVLGLPYPITRVGPFNHLINMCCQSFSCAFYGHRVFDPHYKHSRSFFVRFLCTLGAFDPHCTCSTHACMHVKCYQSSWHTFYACFYAC